MVWANVVNFVGAFGPCLSRQLGTGVGETIWLGHTSGGLVQSFDSTTGAGSGGLSGGTITLGRWSHFAYTWDGVTKRLFQDGVQIATGALSGVLSATTREFLLAANNNGAGLAPSEFFDGRLEDLRVYNRGLGQAEIETIVAGKGKDGIYAGLLARYPMNEQPHSAVSTIIMNLADVSTMQVTSIVNAPTISFENITVGRGRRQIRRQVPRS